MGLVFCQLSLLRLLGETEAGWEGRLCCVLDEEEEVDVWEAVGAGLADEPNTWPPPVNLAVEVDGIEREGVEGVFGVALAALGGLSHLKKRHCC
jgi:hypothetical protein